MSFGFGRAQQSDSWTTSASRRSTSYSSRMHSIPRANNSRYSYGSSQCSDCGYDGQPDTYSSITSMSHYSHPMDLKRKTVFHLHEEVEKPTLTIMLEEITDGDRILGMCLNTLQAMMNSKTHRKFLHHMNNNAAVVYEPGDFTFNSKIITSGGKKIKIGEAAQGSKGANGSMGITESEGQPSRSETIDKELSNMMNHADYTSESMQNRKRRQEEINALAKLKQKLPPLKTKRSSFSTAGPSVGARDSSEKTSASDKALAAKRLHDRMYPEEIVEEQEDALKKKKTKPIDTPEQTLKTRYLRLTKEQVADLEEEIRAAGRDPVWHNYTTPDIRDVFKK